MYEPTTGLIDATYISTLKIAAASAERRPSKMSETQLLEVYFKHSHLSHVITKWIE